MTSARSLIDRVLPGVRSPRSFRTAINALPAPPPPTEAARSVRDLERRLWSPSFTLVSYNTYLMDVTVNAAVVLREVIKENSTIPLMGFVAGALQETVSTVVSALEGAWDAILGFFGADTENDDAMMLNIQKKPACGARADEIGEALGVIHGATPDDLIAPLYEVWTTPYRDRILSRLNASLPAGSRAFYADGPGAGPEDWRAEASAPGSGLCVVSTTPVAVVGQTTYFDRGTFSRDSDWYSAKGAIMTRLEDRGIDLVSTHLHWGGELVTSPFQQGIATALINVLNGRWNVIDVVLRNESVFCDPTPEQSRHVRARQLDQLVGFIDTHRDPHNVVIVTGDFNLNANDPDDYARIEDFCRRLGLRDMWREQYTQAEALLARGGSDNGGPDSEVGRICSATSGPQGVAVCDEAAAVPEVGRRFDYVLVERPKPEHARLVDVEVLYRVPSPRPGQHAGGDDPLYTSDHLALVTRVHSTKRSA